MVVTDPRQSLSCPVNSDESPTHLLSHLLLAPLSFFSLSPLLQGLGFRSCSVYCWRFGDPGRLGLGFILIIRVAEGGIEHVIIVLQGSVDQAVGEDLVLVQALVHAAAACEVIQ